MLSEQAGNRELITLTVHGIELRGTYHHPASRAGAGVPDQGVDIAILFLNSLSSPRSLIGDSAVYWADSVAAEGYPAFRIDLPGLGDSDGERPNNLLKFTNEGGYAKTAASIIKELVKNHGIAGVVMFGHCAGATTAIYAAAECKQCRGLILMDPYFNLPKSLTSSLRPELVNWARQSKLGGFLRTVYDRVREIPGALGKGALPANANFNLINRCKRLLATGLPILIMQAPQPYVAGGKAIKAGSFDYLSFIVALAQDSRQFTVKTLEDADHSFANRMGRMLVRRDALDWLSQYFPNMRAVTATQQIQPGMGQDAAKGTSGTSVAAQIIPEKELIC